MDRRQERGRTTRDHLLTVATGLFTERGYEGTSIEAVLAEAGISRGALYHHFPGKDALFTAVFEAVHDRVAVEVAAAGKGKPGGDALRLGCLAWIRSIRDPAVHRIVLVDAPAVLGWARWREADEKLVLPGLRHALAAAGTVPRAHLEVFALALLAGLNEIAMTIARADDPNSAATAAEAALDEFLGRVVGSGS
ncbi:TetR/AcrR family transcriptional regulator [Amycolatopsis suaedae]|uniref:TetR/AcrR family transcriptional regulator n=1 Tax=Amycolatopsis suaedae TaxID=2510978 RepID=A0A4Q7J6J3_9PSEU|nr:TetR/AcrR family transcriptional regulator [Amycolatopsis suaedae]RZQ61933.1 TetR/AcrR family transcriptional regulator [Amycolatopsis suaedae]